MTWHFKLKLILFLLAKSSFFAENGNFCKDNGNKIQMQEDKSLNITDCNNLKVELEEFRASLRKVFASGNNFTVLEDSWLEDAKELVEIHFSNCEIEKISQKAFKDQMKLQTLDLKANKLTTLCPGIFDNLIELRNLLLEFNKITIIHDNLWRKNLNLKLIDLKNNSIFAFGNSAVHDGCHLNFENNFCIDTISETKSKINRKLSTCFENYKNLKECGDKEDCSTSLTIIITIFVTSVIYMSIFIIFSCFKFYTHNQSRQNYPEPVYYMEQSEININRQSEEFEEETTAVYATVNKIRK